MALLELQNQILNNTELMFRLASAIDKLPDSETRGELMYKHNQVATRLANQQVDLGQINKDACYYGFMEKCPGCYCADCEYYYLDRGKIPF